MKSNNLLDDQKKSGIRRYQSDVDFVRSSPDTSLNSVMTQLGASLMTASLQALGNYTDLSWPRLCENVTR